MGEHLLCKQGVRSSSLLTSIKSLRLISVAGFFLALIFSSSFSAQADEPEAAAILHAYATRPIANNETQASMQRRIITLNQACQLNPQFTQAYYDLARLHQASNNRPAFIQALKAYLKVRPSDDAAQRLLIETLMADLNDEEKLRLLNQLAKNKNETFTPALVATLYLKRFLLLKSSGQKRIAMKALQAAIATNANYPPAIEAMFFEVQAGSFSNVQKLNAFLSYFLSSPYQYALRSNYVELLHRFKLHEAAEAWKKAYGDAATQQFRGQALQQAIEATQIQFNAIGEKEAIALRQQLQAFDKTIPAAFKSFDLKRPPLQLSASHEAKNSAQLSLPLMISLGNFSQRPMFIGPAQSLKGQCLIITNFYDKDNKALKTFQQLVHLDRKLALGSKAELTHRVRLLANLKNYQTTAWLLQREHSRFKLVTTLVLDPYETNEQIKSRWPGGLVQLPDYQLAYTFSSALEKKHALTLKDKLKKTLSDLAAEQPEVLQAYLTLLSHGLHEQAPKHPALKRNPSAWTLYELLHPSQEKDRPTFRPGHRMWENYEAAVRLNQQ